MTPQLAFRQLIAIIPYQELLGNYDHPEQGDGSGLIIPYQELLGNYDPRH